MAKRWEASPEELADRALVYSQFLSQTDSRLEAVGPRSVGLLKEVRHIEYW